MSYTIYHYGSPDGSGDIVDDRGWGCSYRNLQTVVAAAVVAGAVLPAGGVPTMPGLLRYFGHQPKSSCLDLWLEPRDVGRFLESLGLRCQHLLHLTRPGDVRRMLKTPPAFYGAGEGDGEGLGEHGRQKREKGAAGGGRVVDGQGLLRALRKHFGVSGALPAIIDDGVYSFALRANPKPGAEFELLDPHRWLEGGRSDRPLTRPVGTDFLLRSFWMVLLPAQTCS